MKKQIHCVICGVEPRHHYADKARSCLNKLNQEHLKNIITKNKDFESK